MNDPAAVCPYCFAPDPYRWGRKDEVQRYRCRACSKTFTPLTGTPLARQRHREASLRFARAMVDELSVRKAAVVANVHRTTSVRWRHRMLADTAQLKGTELSGIVEADMCIDTHLPAVLHQFDRVPRVNQMIDRHLA